MHQIFKHLVSQGAFFMSTDIFLPRRGKEMVIGFRLLCLMPWIFLEPWTFLVPCALSLVPCL